MNYSSLDVNTILEKLSKKWDLLIRYEDSAWFLSVLNRKDKSINMKFDSCVLLEQAARKAWTEFGVLL